jgi:hypothetical protein
LNVSTLQQRILKIEHEIDTSLAEKKRPKKERKSSRAKSSTRLE